MPRYIARIELVSVPQARDREVYQQLHDQLRKQNIYRSIRGDNGKWAMLPPATYQMEFQTETVTVVRDSVRAIVNTVWPVSRVLVIRASASAWIGLEVVDGLV